MARSTKSRLEVEKLVEQSASARLQLGRAHSELKQKLDVVSQVKKSVKTQPTKWLFGGLATGLVGSFLFKKKRKASPVMIEAQKVVGKHGSFWMKILKLVFKMSQPLLKVYATKLLRELVTRKIQAKYSL